MGKKLKPSEGGCWFCHREVELDENGLYSGEFETNLHKQCLEERLEKYPTDREAIIIASDLGLVLKQ